MDFNRQNIQSKVRTAETHVIDEGLRAYMLKVYNYMASGIFLTGIISLLLFKLSVVINIFNILYICSWKCQQIMFHPVEMFSIYI